MHFPKRYAELAARLRVPAGFVVSGLFLVLAKPTWTSLAIGGSIGLAGLGLRAWAAGHLEKNEKLATSGPFAYTRNPLYVGTLTVGAAFAIAGSSVAVGVILLAFFVLFYLPVVGEEEGHLRRLFPAYGDYERRVPKFLLRLSPAFPPTEKFRWDLYKKNEEYQALAAFALVIGLLAAKLQFL
jgi:protein-S-isoprenylcysteine O-methyltransferase Ste14